MQNPHPGYSVAIRNALRNRSLRNNFPAPRVFRPSRARALAFRYHDSLPTLDRLVEVLWVPKRRARLVSRMSESCARTVLTAECGYCGFHPTEGVTRVLSACVLVDYLFNLV
eukprot:scaffold4097_cov306-Pinguiococcus_pyrenoidosus.AAC.4